MGILSIRAELGPELFSNLTTMLGESDTETDGIKQQRVKEMEDKKFSQPFFFFYLLKVLTTWGGE